MLKLDFAVKNGHFDFTHKKGKYRPRKVKNPDLQAFLDKYYTQFQTRLADQLVVTQEASYMQVHDMEKMQKVVTWMLY